MDASGSAIMVKIFQHKKKKYLGAKCDINAGAVLHLSSSVLLFKISLLKNFHEISGLGTLIRPILSSIGLILTRCSGGIISDFTG